MIFLLAAVLLLCVWQFTLSARRNGPGQVFKGIALAAVSGFLAGVFIGIGARAGMSAITIANGDAPNFTVAGTLTVVFTFASYGILLGVVYEGLFRRLLRRRGLAYGALLMLCSWYPLAHAGAQQLSGRPSLLSQLFVSGLIVALMWLPFGAALEAILGRWHNRLGARAASDGATA